MKAKALTASSRGSKDEASLGFLLVDDAGRILDAQGPYLQRLGVTSAQLLFMELGDLDAGAVQGTTRFPVHEMAPGEIRRWEMVQRDARGDLWRSELTIAKGSSADQPSYVFVREIPNVGSTDDLLDARIRLSEMATQGQLNDLLQATLATAEALTGSCLGFFHSIDSEQSVLSLQSWSARTLATLGNIDWQQRRFPISETGVWADCVSLGQPVIHNNYAALAGRKGLLAARAEVNRELVVPVFLGQRVTAILGVGNKLTDYDDKDSVLLASLGSLAMDLVERKRAEDRHHASESRFRSLFDTMTQGVVYQDSFGRINSVNPAAERILGYKAQALCELSWEDPIWQFVDELGQSLPSGAHPSEAARNTGKPIRDVVLGHHNPEKRTRVWTLVSAIPEFSDGESQPVQVYTTFEDISTLHRAETEAEESHQRYRAVIDAFHGHIYVSSSTDELEFMNRRLQDEVGTSGIGERCYKVIYGREQRCPDCSKSRIMAGETVVSEIRQKADGRWFSVVNTPLHHSDGSLSMQAVRVDITDQRRGEEERLVLERRLQHLGKLESLGILSAGIAHDFNNILTAILGHAELALGDEPEHSSGYQDLQHIRRSTRQAADLCMQLLAFSGKGRFVMRPIRIEQLADRICTQMRSGLGANIVLESFLPPPPFLVEGDRDQLSQVLISLITNSVEAIGCAPGRICVELTFATFDRERLSALALGEALPEGVYLVLKVEDNGTGMDESTLRRAFDPFFSTRFPGRGLGLPAALGITRAHRGAILLDSQPGRGTTARVLLPPVARPDGRSSDTAGPGSRTRILLVDDDESVRLLGQRALEQAGYSVFLARDGLEAIAVYGRRPEPIGLVILDLTMPNLDGVDTLRALRCLDPDVNVLMVTGYAAEAILERLTEMPTEGYLQKPFAPSELVEKVRVILASRDVTPTGTVLTAGRTLPSQ